MNSEVCTTVTFDEGPIGRKKALHIPFFINKEVSVPGLSIKLSNYYISIKLTDDRQY